MTNATTFAEFVARRRETDDLSECTDAYILETGLVGGLIYLDSFHIQKLEEQDKVEPSIMNTEYVVVIGNMDYNFGDDLDAAEKFLWDEFAMLETNDNLRAVKFGWDDESYDGFTDGSKWNGFDNIWVTEEVHKKIVAEFDALLPAADQEEIKRLIAQPQSEERDDAIYDINSFHLVEIDEQRLYSYAYGYATCIDEERS